MNTYRLLWWSIAVPIGVIGVAAAIVSSSVVTTVIVFGSLALCLGALSANLQAIDHEGWAGGSLSASTVLAHGCAAGFIVVSLYGLATLIEISVLPLALVLAATCPAVVGHWRTREKPLQPASDTDSSPPPTPIPDRMDNPAPALQALTDPEVCMAWRRSFVELLRADSVAAIAEIAEFRQQVLDELERRNPTGFGDWLASGARAPSDPARYLLKRPDGQPRRS